MIPPSRRGEGLGYFSMNFVLATAFGPMLGLFVIHQFSYTILFAVCSACALIALILILLVKIEAPVFTEEQIRNFKSSPSLKDFFEKKAFPMAILIFILSVCYSIVPAFLESYTIELKLGNIASVFFIVYAGVILCVRPFVGRLLDRRGDNIVMLPIIFSFTLGMFLLSNAQGNLLMIVSSVCMSIGFGNIITAGQAIAINASPPHRISTALSTYFILSDLGQGLGPLILGIVAGQTSFSTMYFTAAVIALCTIGLYYILHGRHARGAKK
jgi:MFS family permease